MTTLPSPPSAQFLSRELIKVANFLAILAEKFYVYIS